MKKRIGKGLLSYRGHTFRRSLLLILMVTTIPTLLIAASSYYIGVSYIEREVERTHKLQLDYTVKQVSDALGHLQVGMNQWTLNPLMSDKLRGIDFKDNYAFSKDFFESLTVLNNSSALIDQVFVYLESPPRIISDSQGIHKLVDSGAKPYHELLTVKERLFWRVLQAPALEGLFVIHKLPVIGEPFGSIMARINEKQLLNLAGFDPSLGGTAFILSREGALMSRDLFSPAVLRMNEELVQEINGKQDKSASFRWSWDNELYIVSTATIPVTGWELVSAVPLSEFLKPILIVSRLIMAVGLVSLLFVLLSSWYASVRLVQPIHRLLRTLISPVGTDPLLVPKDEIQFIEEQWRNLSTESHLLQSRLENQHSSLRMGFLLQLVQGHLQLLREPEIRQRMEQYGWEPDGQQFVVIVVQLLGFYRLQGSFREDEQPLVTFAAVNIIEELTGSDNVSVMNLHDLSVGLFIMFPREASPAEVAERLKQMASEIGQSLHRILKMNTVIGLGQTVSAISRIPIVWAEVQQALRHRKLDVPNQIIDLNEPMGVHAESRYPFTLEQDLIHAMLSGLGEESRRLLGEFYLELKVQAELELVLQQGSLRLLGAMQGALMKSDVMQAGSLFDWGQLYAELLALKDSDEMQDWFVGRIMEPLIAELTHHQNDRARMLVERVVGMIRSEYRTDISLDLCADRLGISSSGLSKLFMQVTGVYFVDYLTKTRLDRAKELLIGSELKMQEIAVQIGYQPTYFNRIFKKMEGMTPKDFREHHKL
ncbi:helix-turn-helix domain-containing protein [Paenibacillus planticolens]|uniref:Helix-turn-helix domain-containing protein n=1 Tax=Paenibacillus planticolens TaxID=2654976 RepID=A0ABX1ZXE1_9BACL|nr:helix-turn-helix domain-containing protein [Paenibacillus planticolens]NOV04707.1 helix-turn-helix domain-containing protein [Paenibacillus planticolens]